VNLPRAEYESALVGFGLPKPIAGLLADADSGASQGGLFDDAHQLGMLIGRSTALMSETIAEALKA